MRATPLLIAGALGLAGCGGLPEVAKVSAPAPIASRSDAPPDAPPGTCWALDVTPARIETVIEQTRVAPGGAGQTAAWQSESRSAIVEERREVWFETACESDLTPDVVASLQRALAARGLYDGPATGAMDAATRAAVRRYQRPRGLDSALLSLAAARDLGLAAVEVPGAAEREPGASADTGPDPDAGAGAAAGPTP
jgi:hypothetical protein